MYLCCAAALLQCVRNFFGRISYLQSWHLLSYCYFAENFARIIVGFKMFWVCFVSTLIVLYILPRFYTALPFRTCCQMKSVSCQQDEHLQRDPQIKSLRTQNSSLCSDWRLSVAIDPDLLGTGFNAAITACEKAGQWEFALELLETMTEFILESSVISPDLKVCQCLKTQDV